jgi:molecular chaperone DnaK (HSP70)
VAERAKDFKINRIISHHLGCVALDAETRRLMSFLMLRLGTPLPANHVERFVTLHDGQEMVEFPVTQDGYYADEHQSEVEDCTNLGTVTLGPLAPGLPMGTPIEVTYLFSEEGILTVTAKETKSGIDVSVEIEHRGALSDSDFAMARQKIDDLNVSS